VTPEAFRYVKPAFAGVVNAIIVVVLYSVIYVMTIALMTFFVLFLFPRTPVSLVTIAVTLGIVGLIAVLLFMPTPRIDAVSVRATANGAMIGIVLFLLTRAVALALAMHDLAGHHASAP